MGCNLWSATYGMQPKGCKLWGATYEVQPMECNLWSATNWVQPMGCNLWPAIYGLQPKGCKLWGASYEVQPVRYTTFTPASVPESGIHFRPAHPWRHATRAKGRCLMSVFVTFSNNFGLEPALRFGKDTLSNSKKEKITIRQVFWSTWAAKSSHFPTRKIA